MKLSKWLPFKFLRKDKEGASKNEQAAEPRASGYQSATGLQPFDRWSQRAWENPFAALHEAWPWSGGRSDAWFGDHSPGAFSPRVDVAEEKSHLRVSAEVPGLGPEDVEVKVQEGLLTLRGEKRHEAESLEDGCFRAERSYGFFERHVPLPVDIDTENAEATFDKGVLAVRFPKHSEAGAARRIPIRSS